LLWENLEQGKRIARRAEQLNKNPFLERFRAIVDEGVARGLFRAPRDVRHLLVNFIGLCFVYYSNQYSLAASIGIDPKSARARTLRIEQATDLVLHGLLNGR
jgi:TetR/AcrR family transcriptional regulator